MTRPELVKLIRGAEDLALKATRYSSGTFTPVVGSIAGVLLTEALNKPEGDVAKILQDQ